MANLFDNYDDMEEGEEGEVRCKNCHERYLHWEEARNKYNQKKFVLMNEDDSIHNCPAFTVAAADEFKDG